MNVANETWPRPRLMTIGWPGLDSYRPRPGRSGGRWIPLPVEGSRLERCYIETSGKEGEMIVKVDGHVPVRVGVGGDVSFSSLGGVQQWLHAIDDNRVGLLIEPGDRPVTLVEAKIAWWLDEPWQECFAEALREAEWDLAVACDIRLGFKCE